MHKSCWNFSIILSLLQAVCLAKQDVLELYFDVTDCGNDSIFYTSMSVTPYPLFIVQPFNFWFGGQILCSEKAQEFTQNMTFDYFNQNLNSTFFLDNSSIEFPRYFLPLLQRYNNTRASGKLVDGQLMITLFQAMKKGIRSSSLFIGLGINTDTGDILFHSFFDWLQEQLDKFTPIFIQLRIKLVLNTTEVWCVQFNIRTKKNEALEYDARALAQKNYALAFETHNYKNRERKLVCPAGSIQSTNSTSTCLCAVPHSGPFCQFQCTLAQVDADGHALCGGTDTICEFSASDYANGCLITHHVPVLNGNITVDMPKITPTQVPEITAARLQKNEVNIDWMLPGQCPGMIIFYDIEILCNEKTSDSQSQAGNSGNISFDCRSHINGTMLVGYVPVNCQDSRNLKVQLRVGTIIGMSNYSKLFEIPDNSWSPLVIAAVAVGAIFISVLVAALGFCYYYKRHVQNYQSVFKTLSNLVTSHRAGGTEQSIRKNSHIERNLPNPTITLNDNSLGMTRFEPSPEVRSSRSLDSPASNVSEDHYNTATFFRTVDEELSNSPHSEIGSIHNNTDIFL